MAFQITTGNVEDRAPVPERTAGLTSILIGDRGSLSKKRFDELWEHRLPLITKIRRNRHHPLMPIVDPRWLRQRTLIESIHAPLKNLQPIEHTRHRRVVNAMVNLLAALVAYIHQPRKPSLHLSQSQLNLRTEIHR